MQASTGPLPGKGTCAMALCIPPPLPFFPPPACVLAFLLASGCFPYPAVDAQRPPLLQESADYGAARARAAALLPQLFTRPGQHVQHAPSAAGHADDDAAASAGLAPSSSSSPPDDGPGSPRACTEHPALPPEAPLASAAAGPEGLAGASTDMAALQRVLSDVHVVAVLLGWRVTPGSVRSLAGLAQAPSARECEDAFEQLHRPTSASVLTVGGTIQAGFMVWL